MTQHSSAWIVFPLQFAAGALIIALARPLARRRIPPNLYYGLRIPATLGDDFVWFEINAVLGRHLIRIGIAYLAAVAVAVVFGEAWSLKLKLLGPVNMLLVMLIIDTVILSRAASRLRRERNSGSTPQSH